MKPARIDHAVDLAYGVLIFVAIGIILVAGTDVGVAFGLGVLVAYVLHIGWKMSQFDPEWMTREVTAQVTEEVSEEVEETVSETVSEEINGLAQQVEKTVGEEVTAEMENTVSQQIEETVGNDVDEVIDKLDEIEDRTSRAEGDLDEK